MKYSYTLSTDSRTIDILSRLRPDLEKMIRTRSRPLYPLPTETLPILRPLEGIRAVLFDIYGTLLISASGEVGSLAGETADGGTPRTSGESAAAADLSDPRLLPFYQALSSVGYLIDDSRGDFDRRTRKEYTRLILEEHEHKKNLGVDFPEVDILSIWHRLITIFLTKGEIHSPRGPISEPDSLEPDPELLMKLSLRYELLANRVWPMPGALEILEYLRGRGFRLGIVSNAQFYTPLILESLFAMDLGSLGFEDKLCEWSYVGGRAKPSPDLFSRVLEELAKEGITPEEVLYVGNDMLNDVYAAGVRACRTCLYAGDTRSLRLRKENPQLHSLRPDGIINRLSQLSQLLGTCTGTEGTHHKGAKI